MNFSQETNTNMLEAKSKSKNYFFHHISTFISGEHHSLSPYYIGIWLCKQAQPDISSQTMTIRI